MLHRLAFPKTTTKPYRPFSWAITASSSSAVNVNFGMAMENFGYFLSAPALPLVMVAFMRAISPFMNSLPLRAGAMALPSPAFPWHMAHLEAKIFAPSAAALACEPTNNAAAGNPATSVLRRGLDGEAGHVLSSGRGVIGHRASLGFVKKI